ncbi:MAG: glycosyltransferase [Bryobacteraceae bacterium]|nr:glycosyltransferase [Bryobacteraceae bacterium]
MKLAALVITHNSAGHIGPCLSACLRFRGDFAAGILVIDNASTDGTCAEAEAAEGVRLIRNSANRGFAGAANQGFRALAGADAVLLLNPDVEIASPPSVLARALGQDPRIGAAGGLLLGRDGAPQRGFAVRRLPGTAALAFEVLGINRLWPGNPVNRRYRALDLPLSEAVEGVQPPGACLMVRRAAWEQAGGFDEGFHPVWFEDVDFIRRLRDAGWKTLFVPEFRAVHAGGHSVLRLEWERRQLYWYRSLLRYVSRHLHAPGRVSVCLSVIAGVLPRIVTGIVATRSADPLRVYGRLVRLAARAAVFPAAASRPRPEDDLREPVQAPGRPGI